MAHPHETFPGEHMDSYPKRVWQLILKGTMPWDAFVIAYLIRDKEEPTQSSKRDWRGKKL